MADESALGDLLDQAGKVFSLAGTLGSAFQDEHQRRRQEHRDAVGWERHAATFQQFYDAVLNLLGSMQNPPIGFDAVANQLNDAARLAKSFRDAIQRVGGQARGMDYLDSFPRWNSVGQDGWQAVKDARKALALDDPFASVDDPRRTTLQPPADWDGTLDNWPGAKARGFLVDEIGLGPTAAWGNTFPISSFDCIPVEGSVPTICPNADRKPQAEWLPGIERRFRDLNLVKKGQTIHWVGSQSKPGNVCGCFHPDRNLSETRDDATAGKLAADAKVDNKGVSLFDVAFAIEEDDKIARQSVKQWIDNKRISAKPIGKCPHDGRRQIYRLSELLSDVKKILALDSKELGKYRQALTAKLRSPRSE